jgi:hypothetical protein
LRRRPQLLVLCGLLAFHLSSGCFF